MKRKSMKLISFLMAASLLIGTPAQAVLGQEQETEIVTEDIQEEELQGTEEATEEELETSEDEIEVLPEESIEEELQDTETATEESIEENTEVAEDETEIFPEESIEEELQETEETEIFMEEMLQDTEDVFPEEMAQDKVENNVTYAYHDGSKKVDGFVYYLKADNTIGIQAYDTAYMGADKKVVIPERIDGYPVTEIDEAAFYNEGVQTVVFPSTLKKIGKQAFCYSDLRSFSFAGNETVEVEEFAFSETSMEEIVVPANIKNIPDGCFGDNIYNKSIVIEEGVETIGNYAFQDNQYATSIKIPGTVKTIGENAFSGEMRVEQLIIEEGVKTISYRAFDSFEALTEVTLPKSIESIGEEAFIRCNNNLIISCYTDTCSHKYAVENGFECILLDQPTYTITYELGGGENNSNNPTDYTGTTKTFTFEEPTRYGYTFQGWFTDAEYQNEITKVKKGSSGNLTLYAKWKANSYMIVFKGNKNTTGNMDSQTIKYGKSKKLSKNSFARTGYTFKEWNTKADGSGTSYKNQEEVKNLSSKDGDTITLYAQWKKANKAEKKYSITYKLNKGKNNKNNPSSYTKKTATIKLKNATRKGYTFKGWYSDKKYKNKVTQIKKGSTGNVILYAKWTANQYTIKFNGNGATSGSMKAVKNCKYNKTYTLTKNSFKRKGYTFAGWNTKKDGSGKSYKNKAEIKNLTSKSGGTVTLYAQWKK